MRARLASLMVPVAAFLCATAFPAFADQGDDHQLASINRRLSSLAAQPGVEPSRPLRDQVAPAQPPLALGVQRAQSAGLQAFLARPQVMHMVQYFHSVDRVMHYQGHGVDANLWGVFNRGRGISIRFSRRF